MQNSQATDYSFVFFLGWQAVMRECVVFLSEWSKDATSGVHLPLMAA